MHVSTQRCIVPGQEKHPAIAVGGDAYSSWGDDPRGPCVPSELGAYSMGHSMVTDGGGRTAYFSYVNGLRERAGEELCSGGEETRT
jgi:hypothetical protein